MSVDLCKKAFNMETGEENRGDEQNARDIYIGRIPIMLRSDFCVLSQKSEQERMALRECA